mmetsp:Transcript_1467/g.6030  ORF Transcript_1467/g.6030 Transcript_1467/m.6030 type:complete len:303 (-) Transcript_1467:650-1558(-)
MFRVREDANREVPRQAREHGPERDALHGDGAVELGALGFAFAGSSPDVDRGGGGEEPAPGVRTTRGRRRQDHRERRPRRSGGSSSRVRPRVGTLGTPGRPEGSRGAPARRREAAQPRRRLRRRVHEDVVLVLLGLVLARLVVPSRKRFAPPSVHDRRGFGLIVRRRRGFDSRRRRRLPRHARVPQLGEERNHLDVALKREDQDGEREDRPVVQHPRPNAGGGRGRTVVDVVRRRGSRRINVVVRASAAAGPVTHRRDEDVEKERSNGVDALRDDDDRGVQQRQHAERRRERHPFHAPQQAQR